jgi:hypothetical protein
MRSACSYTSGADEPPSADAPTRHHARGRSNIRMLRPRHSTSGHNAWFPVHTEGVVASSSKGELQHAINLHWLSKYGLEASIQRGMTRGWAPTLHPFGIWTEMGIQYPQALQGCSVDTRKFLRRLPKRTGGIPSYISQNSHVYIHGIVINVSSRAVSIHAHFHLLQYNFASKSMLRSLNYNII